MNAKLQTIEGEADKLELELLRDLYQGDYEPKHMIFLRDLYGLLEKVIDRCRDAGNIILAGGAEVLVAGCSTPRDAVLFITVVARGDHFRIQQRLSRRRERDRHGSLDQSADAAPGDRDGRVL